MFFVSLVLQFVLVNLCGLILSIFLEFVVYLVVVHGFVDHFVVAVGVDYFLVVAFVYG